MLLATTLVTGAGQAVTDWGPGVLTAIVGAFVAWTTFQQTKRGRADTANEQHAANQIKADAQQFQQQQDLIATHVAEIARVNTARTAEQERHDTEVKRLRAVLEDQRRQCAEHSQAQGEVIAVLRGLVASEVNQVAADTVMRMSMNGHPPIEQRESIQDQEHDRRTIEAREDPS